MIKSDKVIKNNISQLLDGKKTFLVKIPRKGNYLVNITGIYRIDTNSDLLKFKPLSSLSDTSIKQYIKELSKAESLIESPKITNDVNNNALFYNYTSESYIVQVNSMLFLPYLQGANYTFKVYKNRLYILDENDNLDIMISAIGYNNLRKD